MALSLAVLLVPIVLIVWFFTRTPSEPQVDTVDWKPTLAQARAKAGYPVLAPAAVPEGWRVTKARYAARGEVWVGSTSAAGNRWELGLLDADQVYLAVDQSDEPASSFISSVTRQGTEDGTTTVESRRWTRYLSADGRTRSLVRTVGRSTAVVVGDAGYDKLAQFAAMLGQ